MATNPWIGRRQSIGIGREATRGVGVDPTYWLNALSFGFADVPTHALSEASFGGIWGGDQSPVTLLHAEGEFDVELGDQSFGLVLYALFGTLSTDADTPVADAYTHNYTLANTNQHTSLAISTIDPIGQFIYELAMIDTFELIVEPDAIVHYTVNFMSKGSQDSGGQVSSFGGEQKFVGRHLTLSYAATTGALPGTSVDAKSLTLRIEKNTEINNVLSTVQPEDVLNKRFNITGEFTLNYEDRTFLDFVKNGTTRALRIDLTHTNFITGSTAFQFTIDLSKVSFDVFDPDFSLDEIVTQTITFNALYDAGTNDNVVNAVTLINGVTSY